MNDEKDENRIRLGDIVEFKTSCGKETIASGVVVDMEEKKIGREVCYWYLFKNETGNGFYIKTNEKKVETVVKEAAKEAADIETEEDMETVPFI